MNIERDARKDKKGGYPLAAFPGPYSAGPEFERLLEWVRLVASHARNNLACVEELRQRLRARGESKVRLSEFDQWRPSPVFSEREKAGLNLSQSLSLHEPDELWTAILRDARLHFSAHQIVRLMLAIVSINDQTDFQAKAYDYLLVVEDNPWDEELLLRQLRKTHVGQTALFAQQGFEALELIEDSKRSEWGFIAIFLDLRLRDMKGFELIQRIREVPGMAEIPVIVTTSSRNSRDMEECSRLKVTSYIEKPVTVHSLSKAVAEIPHLQKAG